MSAPFLFVFRYHKKNKMNPCGACSIKYEDIITYKKVLVKTLKKCYNNNALDYGYMYSYSIKITERIGEVTGSEFVQYRMMGSSGWWHQYHLYFQPFLPTLFREIPGIICSNIRLDPEAINELEDTVKYFYIITPGKTFRKGGKHGL